MRIGDLYGRHKGQTLFIVGTSPSARFFDMSLLDGQVTLGLNKAHLYRPLTYSITVHPELVVEYNGISNPNPTQWIVKKKPPMEKLELDDPDYYVFNTSEDFNTVVDRPKDTLFIGRGVQQTAMDLASRMGAAHIVLVGVDMTDVGGDHHGHDQHVRFHGWDHADVYAEYRKWTAKVRTLIRDKWGTYTSSLSPFLGAGHAEEDYRRLKAEFDLPDLPKPKDTSAYMRPKT